LSWYTTNGTWVEPCNNTINGYVYPQPTFTSCHVTGTNDFRVQYHTQSGTDTAVWHNDTITVTSAANCTGNWIPVQYIYMGTTPINEIQPGTFMFNDFAPIPEMPPEEVKDAMERMLSDPEYRKLQQEANAFQQRMSPLLPIANEVMNFGDGWKKVSKNFETVAKCFLESLPKERREEAQAFIEQERARLRPEWERRHKDRQKERAATDRSMRLVKEWLSEAEWNYLQENDEIEFPSQYEKDIIYIVKKSKFAKVEVVKNEKTLYNLCIHPEQELPVGDMMLANIMLLKTDERKFLATANKHM